MKILFSGKDEFRVESDVIILPVFKGQRTPTFKKIDTKVKGLLSYTLRKKPAIADLKGVEVIHALFNGSHKHIFLVGLGERKKVNDEVLRTAGGCALRTVRDYQSVDAAISVKDLTSHNFDYLSFVEGFLLNHYSFEKYKNHSRNNSIKNVYLLTAKKKEKAEKIKRLTRMSEAVYFVRDLVNYPSNTVTPSFLAESAKKMQGSKLKVKVLGKNEIKKKGLNAFHSVAKGSKEEPKFIVMKYSGGKGSLIVVVGKAVTFDSGGISLKPSEGMEKMKYDMAGGAVVLGVMRAVKDLNLSVNVAGIIPACENLPSGTASKPGDVIRTYSQKTVEIVNTDAEGRLVLADAIGYGKKLKPAVIIDIATLTGACSVALGNEAIAMMGNDQRCLDTLKKASAATGEKVWQMPLYDEYGEYIKSDIADVKNSGGRSGSLVTAGYFLKEFAENTPWVHLDIASTAWSDKDRAYIPKGATGVGVRLLMEFLGEVTK